MCADRSMHLASVQPLLQVWFPLARGVPRLYPLAVDASTRRYVRVQWQKPVAGCPASCVLMCGDAWESSATPDFLSVGRHLHACGVRVPQVYGVSASHGWMALEDFGDCSLAALWQQATGADRLLWGKRAIDELVKMHTLGTQHDDPLCPAFHLAFDVPKLLSELQFFCRHAIEGLWQQQLAEADRATWEDAFRPLCQLLAAQPRYFCHRDYHGWNIMVQADTVGVLDFQDARLGPQPYDLVSLLVDRGIPGILGPPVMQALIDYYLQRLEAETGCRIDRASFRELYDYVTVQRCLKAIGTFAYMTVVRQRPQYVPYIAPTLAYIRPLVQRYYTLQPLAGLLRTWAPC